MRTIACLLCLMMLALPGSARVLLRAQGPGIGKNVLREPGFEETAAAWQPYDRGFAADSTVRHSGKSSIRCENPSADVSSGAFQMIVLDQKSPRCIRASAWSRAEDVGSAARGDYALYLDIQYADGSWVWGMIFDFPTGTHGWQHGEVSFEPEKPVKQVMFYVLLRRCTGQAWFDDCRLEEPESRAGSALFDGVLVREIEPEAARTSPLLGRDSKSHPNSGETMLRTSDGLEIRLALDGTLAGGKLGGRALPPGGGFYMRDVAGGSDFVSLDDARIRTVKPGEMLLSGECQALGLALDARITARSDHIRFDCEALDKTGRDRAITVGFAVPLPEGDSTWWHSIRSSDKITAGRTYCDAAPIEAGATGQISKYPFACVTLGRDSLNLAIPMDEPCVYRTGVNGSLGWYTIAFDLGFCPEMGVSRQKFSFLIYRGDGPGGMRAAADKYYRIFPEYFVKRVEREGNWMAFKPVSSVPHWEDFGFAYHEGDNDIAWDAEHGVYSFRYTEPMSYWMPLVKEVPRTPEKAFEIIDANLRQTADAGKREWASATKLCLADDDYGKPRVFFFDAPWCDGAMFVLNCNPAIPKGDLPATKASMSWNPEIAQRLYGDKTKPQLAGEYLDSVEMGSEYVNCRREHFRHAVRPLSFSRRTNKPVILQILSTYEFASSMADDVHRRGKLMMANTIPTRYGFMAHLFDVMGIETNWFVDGKYAPLPDDVMDLRRTLCYQKPFCFLMNTDYEKFDHAMVEKYFQRCLFWGMFPGFFSPDAATRLYFDQPKFFERDRDLFKKFIPVIKRIAAAGWAPLTLASTSDANVEIERFGPGKDGSLFFTVRNGHSESVRTELRLDAELGSLKSAIKLPAGELLSVNASRQVEFSLGPEQVAAIGVLMLKHQAIGD
jgi:hypothetical protein